jgi:UDP-N-acetylmuramoyl-L-alanyl-D-glutamate--2,6-diaminopimelate ligase
MKLVELAAGVPQAQVGGGGEYEVARVVQDSRRAGPADLFVAVKGLRVDGHDHAAEAASRGAALALERLPAGGLPPGTAWLRLPDTRWGLGELAAELHGRPARRMLVVGVTGTYGKTTTTHLAGHLLEQAGIRTGFLSTVAHRAAAAAEENRSGQTTMEAPEIQEWLARMARGGAQAAVLETTSHALVQGRVSACDFDVAAITHVGHDHLDYHGSWEDYVRAKGRLVELCAAAARKTLPSVLPPSLAKTAVLNRGDASFPYLAAIPIERRLSYSLGGGADLGAAAIETGESASRFRLRWQGQEVEARLGMPARFNVANALCASGVALAVGLSIEQVAAGLGSFPGVRGRLEPVELGQPFKVFVDFAHSAGALAGALAELRSISAGRLLAVFGSTGRADHDRPGMGRAAAQGSDFFVITTDDPVGEDPAAIAKQVAEGAVGREPGRDYEIELDRRAAIRRALSLARPGDVVLLAGKGHERTMIMSDGAEPWDERAEAEAALRELGLAAPR